MSIWCRCLMQGCKCKVYPWWCQRTYLNHDANVFLCVCNDANVHVDMSWCKCFDANTIYSKILFVFKIKPSSAPETKNIFKSWFVISRKVIFLFFLLFWLKAPKKLVITVRNLWIGHLLEIWWSGSKDLFSQIWLSKEVARFQSLFFWKNKSFENQAS